MNKFLLFDENAALWIVSKSRFQSVEYPEGEKLIRHVLNDEKPEIIENVAIRHSKEGVFFVGDNTGEKKLSDHKLFCVDMISCGFFQSENEKKNGKNEPKFTDIDLLIMLQKSLRAVLKVWNLQGFTNSERVSGTKLIVFPFVGPDHRRLVIERENKIVRLEKRNITHPLLAYKFSSDNNGEDIVDNSVLLKAGEEYLSILPSAIQGFIEKKKNPESGELVEKRALTSISGKTIGNAKEDFGFRGYDNQYGALTTTQKNVVDYSDDESPLRIDGPAGTGKTISMIMRAYRLLREKKNQGHIFKIIFFTHSSSTCRRVNEVFRSYEGADCFLNENAEQSIIITTLLDYCTKIADIREHELLDSDAGEAKSAQLMLIGDALNKAVEMHIVNTYLQLLSNEMKNLFSDLSSPNFENICSLLLHEFGIQIKGRTDCTIDAYKELNPITNGLNCITEKDKEFVFTLFTFYQAILNQYRYLDIADVVLETLSRLNAPVWRRDRIDDGFDYIFVDEMHLFDKNEQSIFHYLTRDNSKKKIPICFAIDYSQAIGDRGDTSLDYIENSFGIVEKRNYQTVFRNSPQIAEFCASIAASGTIMFQTTFRNPYKSAQSAFTELEDIKSNVPPQLVMNNNDDEMYGCLRSVLDKTIKDLKCKKRDVAIISFDTKNIHVTVEKIKSFTGKQVDYIGNRSDDSDSFVLATPYDINGLEFDAVIMVGVDEGRVPQTVGTSDVSKHFIRYSAYNMLYLSASRAKYRLVIMGSLVNGTSSCLEHSLQNHYLSISNEYDKK